MAATQLHAFIQHLRRLLRGGGDGGLPDAELLERYTTLRDEAARELGWAKGTVSTRLIHARELLRRRLQRHGDTFPTLLPALREAALPAKLAKTTLRGVLSVRTPNAAGHLISAKALALTEGALQAMALSQWKTAAALLLLVVSLGTGAGWLAYEGVHASSGASDVAPVSQANDRAAGGGLPSALGQLDPSGIPPDDRFAWQPPELVSVLGEHRGRSWGMWVQRVAFSPDGKLIASCGEDPIVRLWDAATLRECAALKQHAVALTQQVQMIRCVAFSPDGKTMASGGDDHTLVLWDLTTAPPLARTVLDLAEPVYAFAFSPDGSTLAYGSYKGVRLWKVTGSIKLEQLALLSQVRAQSLSFSSDGKTLACGSTDGTVIVWDLLTATQKGILRATTRKNLWSVALSPDGKMLACGGDNSKAHPYPVLLWDVSDPEHPRERALPSKPTHQVYAVKFSPDGKTLATGNHDGTLRLWKLANGAPREQAVVPMRWGWIQSLDFSPNGKTLVLGHSRGLVTLWDARTPVPTQRFPLEGHTAHVHTMALAGTGMLASGCNDFTVRLWDLSGVQAKERFWFACKGIVPLDGLALSNDGKTLAFDRGDGTLEVWAVSKQTPRKRLQWSAQKKENEFGCSSLEISPDGKVLVSSGPDNLIRFWDLTTDPPQERNHIKGRAAATSWVGFGPDATSATVVNYGSNSAGAEFALWHSGPSIRLWDVALRSRPKGIGEHRDPMYAVAFAPHGETMKVGGGKPNVLTGPPLDTGERRKDRLVRLEGTAGKIYVGAVSPDGQTLASAAKDGKVILWEAATGAKYREWQLPGTVYRVAFADDGRHLITANANGTLYVLRLGHGVQASTNLSVLWQTLATGSAAKAYPAIWSLAATPRRTLAFFKDHLQPVKTLPAEDIEQLIARLSSDQFQERARATAALEELREQAEPALCRRLVKQPLALELWQRIEGILNESKPISPERLRALRAIQILEQIGNRDAQTLLKRLAQGAPGTADAASTSSAEAPG